MNDIYYIMYTIYICIYAMMYVCMCTYYAPRSYKHIVTYYPCISMEKTLTNWWGKTSYPFPHASSFDLQLSKCQKATGALNSRNTSATVKLKPRGPGFLRDSNRPTQILGWLVSSWFQPILKICMYFPHKKGPSFLKREMNHPNPSRHFFLKAILFVFRVDRACIRSKKWKLMICYAKSVAAFGR